MRTKVVSFFILFQELSNKKKIEPLDLRPKMIKIASRGSCLNVFFLYFKRERGEIMT